MYLQQVIRTSGQLRARMFRQIWTEIKEGREELAASGNTTRNLSGRCQCKVVQKHVVRIDCGYAVRSEYLQQRKRQARLAIGLYTEKLYGPGSQPEQHLFLSEYQYQLLQYHI